MSTTAMDQRMANLQRANSVRMGRAAIKRDIAAGILNAAEILTDPPAETLAMRVYDLLVAVPGWGPTKAGRIIDRHRLPAVKRIGGLTERQRLALSDELRG